VGNEIIIVTLLVPSLLETTIPDLLLEMAATIILPLPVSTVGLLLLATIVTTHLLLLAVLVVVNMMIIEEDRLPWLKGTVSLLLHLLITEAVIRPLQMLLIVAILHLRLRLRLHRQTTIVMTADQLIELPSILAIVHEVRLVEGKSTIELHLVIILTIEAVLLVLPVMLSMVELEQSHLQGTGVALRVPAQLPLLATMLTR